MARVFARDEQVGQPFGTAAKHQVLTYLLELLLFRFGLAPLPPG